MGAPQPPLVGQLSAICCMLLTSVVAARSKALPKSPQPLKDWCVCATAFFCSLGCCGSSPKTKHRLQQLRPTRLHWVGMTCVDYPAPCYARVLLANRLRHRGARSQSSRLSMRPCKLAKSSIPLQPTATDTQPITATRRHLQPYTTTIHLLTNSSLHTTIHPLTMSCHCRLAFPTTSPSLTSAQRPPLTATPLLTTRRHHYPPQLA
jgi:hypothetical protein